MKAWMARNFSLYTQEFGGYLRCSGLCVTCGTRPVPEERLRRRPEHRAEIWERFAAKISQTHQLRGFVTRAQQSTFILFSVVKYSNIFEKYTAEIRKKLK